MRSHCITTTSLLLIGLLQNAFGQNNSDGCRDIRVQYDKYYYFTVRYQFQKTDLTYTCSDEYAMIPGFRKFKIIKPDEHNYLVKFIDTLSDQLFLLDKNIFNCNAVVASARYFSFSVTTLPIKVRAFPKDYFDWELNKNLGVGIGYYSPWAGNENLSVGVLLNAGTSGILIDSFSTHGITSDLINADVLSVSLGICLLFSKNFQVGVMGGYDMTSSRFEKYGWVYNKCPWLGFGMGYSFVNILEKNI